MVLAHKISTSSDVTRTAHISLPIISFLSPILVHHDFHNRHFPYRQASPYGPYGFAC